MLNRIPPVVPPAAPFLSDTLVLIPALNEESCVGETVTHWRALGVAGVRVIDNGSTDATARLAAAAGAEVVSEPARGYGAAAWRGLQDWPERCQWVLFSAADGSDRLAPEDAAGWQAAIDAGADFVLGDRVTLAASRAELKPTQRLGNWLVCRAIQLGWGRKFSDMASLRLIRHAALEQMRLTDRGFGWNVEMQVRALELRLSVVEIPIHYFPRCGGESKISGSLAGTWRAGLGMLRMLAKLWRWSRQTGNPRVPARVVNAIPPNR